MNFLQVLIYPALLFLLFKRAKIFKKNEWNDEALSLKSTKMLQGFAAVVIVLHHISQQTCAPYLSPEVIVHGLDLFVFIGYLMVTVFFLFSGFGMYKGYKNKENYFSGYFMRRIFPILFIHFLSSSAWAVVRHFKDCQISFATFFDVGGPDQLNPFAWYIVVILYLYILFWFAFGKIKREGISFAVMAAGILVYMFFCDYLVYGTWWYTTIPVFYAGLLLGKYEEKIIMFLKKNYTKLAVIITVCFVIFHEVGNRSWILKYVFGSSYSYTVERLGGVFGLTAAALLFGVLLVMFQLKISLGNKVLAFLGSITLELYLTHGIFVDLFARNFISAEIEPLVYISNPFLYVLVVFAISIPIAFLFMKLKCILCDFLNKIIRALTKKQIEEGRKKRKFKWRVVFIILGILAVIYIARYKGNKEIIDAYSKKVSRVNVEGKEMAYYSTGEGKDTVVLIPEEDSTAGIIGLRPVADEIAKLDLHVVTLELFGHTFSDDADSQRTSQNIAKEIDEALTALSEDGPFIFVAVRGSGMYVRQYACDNPEKVKGVILIDSYAAGMENEIAGRMNMSMDAFSRFYRQRTKWSGVQARFLDFVGYSAQYNTAMAELVYINCSGAEKEVIAANTCINQMNRNMISEELMLEENLKNDATISTPSDIPVLYLLSYAAVEYDAITPKWMELHENQITNSDIQSIVTVNGDPYFLYYNWRYAAPKIKGFINGI